MIFPSSDRPRLIEVAFPLKQAALDSVHEKNARHGHIFANHLRPRGGVIIDEGAIFQAAEQESISYA